MVQSIGLYVEISVHCTGIVRRRAATLTWITSITVLGPIKEKSWCKEKKHRQKKYRTRWKLWKKLWKGDDKSEQILMYKLYLNCTYILSS